MPCPRAHGKWGLPSGNAGEPACRGSGLGFGRCIVVYTMAGTSLSIPHYIKMSLKEPVSLLEKQRWKAWKAVLWNRGCQKAEVVQQRRGQSGQVLEGTSRDITVAGQQLGGAKCGRGDKEGKVG